MDDTQGYLEYSFLEENKKKPIRDVVKRSDWQKLRESFKGTWMKTPEANCKKLRAFLGNIKFTEDDKLRIVMNYLTGTGFRTGRIKHKCIQSIRDDVSAEIKRRKSSPVSEGLTVKLNEILQEKIQAIIADDEIRLFDLDAQEHDLLEQFVNDSHLNVTSMQLSPREAQKVLQGEEVLIIRYQRDQDRYEQNREYNAQGLDGEELGFKIQTTKVFQSTIDELQKRGAKNELIDRMYEKGSFPDDQVDLIRIRKVQ